MSAVGDSGGEAAGGSTRPAKTRWSVVWLTYGAGVVVAFQIGKMPSALPDIRADLGLDIFTAGWVISLFNVIAVSCGIFAGALADWLGHRRIAVAGLACIALASLAGAFADGVVGILFSRFVEGVGALAVFVAAPVLIARSVSARDARLAFGVWGCFMPTGMALMVVLTPLFLAPPGLGADGLGADGWGLAGWRGLWIANAAILALFALVLWVGTRAAAPMLASSGLAPSGSQPGRARGTALWRDIRLTIAAPGPVLLALCFATYAGNYLAVLGFLPTFLIEERAFDPGAAAVLTAIAIAVNIFGNLLGGWLLHRGARRWVLIAISSAIMGASSIGIYSTQVPDEARYLLCLAFSGLGGMLPASIFAGAPALAPGPDQLGATNGLVVQGSNLGQLLVPPALAALVVASGGWQASPWLIAGLSTIGVVLALMIGRLERARAAAS